MRMSRSKIKIINHINKVGKWKNALPDIKLEGI